MPNQSQTTNDEDNREVSIRFIENIMTGRYSVAHENLTEMVNDALRARTRSLATDVKEKQ